MIRLFRLLLLLISALGTPFTVSAQEIKLQGDWTGTSQWLSQLIPTEYHIEQEGLTLSGTAKTKNLNGRDSALFEFNGAIQGNNVTIRGTKFLYRTDGSCLSVVELKYSKDASGEKLTGRWHGDMSLSTCLPGVQGKVEMIRVRNAAAVAVAQTPAEVIHADDFEGNALVKELKQRKYYALIIGIDEYADPSIQALDQPVADAGKLAEILNKDYTFDEKRITLLKNPNRTTIIESLDKLSSELTALDQLLVFYAGHGIWDEQLNQGFWLPSDASLKSKAQWISNSTIRDYIGGIKAKHTLLITDACFSGSIFKERGVFNNSKAILEMYKLPSRKAMTSGALKTVPDKSVFIEYLVKNLINNTEPLLSAGELFSRFKVAVINNSPNGQVPQYGPIGQAGDEGGDFVFLKR